MRIDLHDGYHISAIRDGDQPALVDHFRDKALADALVRLPYPYTQQDADFWIQFCGDLERKNGWPHHFAFRRADGSLVGGIGLILGSGSSGHRAEAGYWLAKEDQGLGLAAAGTQAMVRYGFGELGLKRIEATVAIANVRSQRVLEKAGFNREGLLARYHSKNGVLIDVYMYSIFAPPSPA